MSAVIPILVYHSVRDDALPGLSRWTVSGARFGAHLAAIVASGRTPLTVSEIAEGLRGRRPLPERPVGVTFDDGYDDNRRALERLLEHGLTATLYVTTGAVGRAQRLAAADVRALAAAGGIEVGAHGVGHQRLDELGPAALDRELGESRAALEACTGARVRSFAYPHGDHDRRTRAKVIAHGYESAAAVKNALSHPADDPFAIARWLVEARAPAQRVAEVLEGRGLPHAWSRERLRTRGYRTVRRLRRRLDPTGRSAR